jgi:hypothetical protein
VKRSWYFSTGNSWKNKFFVRNSKNCKLFSFILSNSFLIDIFKPKLDKTINFIPQFSSNYNISLFLQILNNNIRSVIIDTHHDFVCFISNKGSRGLSLRGVTVKLLEIIYRLLPLEFVRSRHLNVGYCFSKTSFAVTMTPVVADLGLLMMALPTVRNYKQSKLCNYNDTSCRPLVCKKTQLWQSKLCDYNDKGKTSSATMIARQWCVTLSWICCYYNSKNLSGGTGVYLYGDYQLEKNSMVDEIDDLPPEFFNVLFGAQEFTSTGTLTNRVSDEVEPSCAPNLGINNENSKISSLILNQHYEPVYFIANIGSRGLSLRGVTVKLLGIINHLLPLEFVRSRHLNVGYYFSKTSFTATITSVVADLGLPMIGVPRARNYEQSKLCNYTDYSSYKPWSADKNVTVVAEPCSANDGCAKSTLLQVRQALQLQKQRKTLRLQTKNIKKNMKACQESAKKYNLGKVNFATTIINVVAEFTLQKKQFGKASFATTEASQGLVVCGVYKDGFGKYNFEKLTKIYE